MYVYKHKDTKKYTYTLHSKSLTIKISWLMLPLPQLLPQLLMLLLLWHVGPVMQQLA